MSALTLKGRMARGLWAQALFVALEVGARFLMVPLYLYAWPLEVYGEWLVILAAVSFLPLLGYGIMQYFSNELLMVWARGERAAFDRMLAVALGLNALVLAIAIPAYALVVWLVASDGGLAAGAMPEATRTQVWLLLGLYMIATIPQGVLTAIYRARTSFALDMYASVAKETAVVAAVAVALALRAPPEAVAAMHLIAGLLVYAPIVADQRRRYPDLRYGLALPRRDELRSFVGHLGWFTVLPLTDRLITNGPVIVLGMVASEAAVVVFSTLRILPGIIRTGAERIAFLAGAEMAPFYARGERELLIRPYMFTGRLAIGLAGFAAGALYAVAEPFLAIWTAGKVPFDAPTLAALLAALVFASHGQICYHYLRYTNRPRSVVPQALGRALVGLALGGALAVRHGPAGMAAGLAVTEIALFGLLMPMLVHRMDGLPLWTFLGRNLVAVAVAFAVSFAAASALVWLIGDRTLLHLVAVGALWSVLMVPPALFLLLDAEHRAWLLAGARRALRRSARAAAP